MDMGDAEVLEKSLLVGRGRVSLETSNFSGGIDGNGDYSESYPLKDICTNESYLENFKYGTGRMTSLRMATSILLQYTWGHPPPPSPYPEYIRFQ